MCLLTGIDAAMEKTGRSLVGIKDWTTEARLAHVKLELEWLLLASAQDSTGVARSDVLCMPMDLVEQTAIHAAKRQTHTV